MNGVSSNLVNSNSMDYFDDEAFDEIEVLHLTEDDKSMVFEAVMTAVRNIESDLKALIAGKFPSAVDTEYWIYQALSKNPNIRKRNAVLNYIEGRTKYPDVAIRFITDNYATKNTTDIEIEDWYFFWENDLREKLFNYIDELEMHR